jgi:uridine kinase
MNDVQIQFPSGKSRTVSYGTRISDLFEEIDALPGDPPSVAALVNNELASLSYKIKYNAVIKPVAVNTPEGMMVYRRSLCFLLTIAVRGIFPERKLIIGHSLGDGYFYHFQDRDTIDPGDIEKIALRIRELVDKDLPIIRTVMSYHDTLDHFISRNQTATAELLESRNESKIPVNRCGDYIDLAHGPLAPCTGVLKGFQLKHYGPGFVLRFPAMQDLSHFAPFRDSPLLFSIYREYKDWGSVLGVATVGRLNKISATKAIHDFIRVAEALHNKKISRIADKIYERRQDIKVVLIAGPSSSGKTTFTKKLAIELTVLGFVPAILSIDDYFVPRELTPKDEDGNYNFEALEAIDIELLNRHLLSLFKNEEVEIPVFDFKTGRRKQQGKKLTLPPNGILLMEGIHGLNDNLTPLIKPDNKYKVYVSALTQLNLDEHNRIPTTDNRLIRRMVRDFQFRGHTAITTLRMWPSVRRGEDKNIFPFQDSADSAFNSALDYELGVLKPIAEPILKTVKPNHELYHEAVRLLSFLNNFQPIPIKYVPENSILREFVGDSGFKY